MGWAENLNPLLLGRPVWSIFFDPKSNFKKGKK
jgi:hypothetical protein